MSKAKQNYWVDVVLALAFAVSGISGLAFLVPPAAGTLIRSQVLGIGLRLWGDIHTWSGLVMMAGVGVHLVLHWRWIIAMTQKAFKAKPQ